MDFHGSKSKLFIIYVVMDLRVAILRFSCVSIFFIQKTDFFAIIFSIFFCIFRVSSMEKIHTHENLKIATLRSIKRSMKIHHAVSEKINDKLFFLKILKIK